jgi:hypothetical protein
MMKMKIAVLIASCFGICIIAEAAQPAMRHMVATNNILVNKIRSMEGEWIKISDAATTLPQTNSIFVVQNDVCGELTVVCTRGIVDTRYYAPENIQTIVFKYFKSVHVVLYPAEKDGGPWSFYRGAYDSTNNCIEWNKPSGLEKKFMRWRFSEDNMFLVKEWWDDKMSEWNAACALYCRRTALPVAQEAVKKLITGGLRDRYGNLVQERIQEEPVNKDYRTQIKHVPDALFSDDSSYTVNASYAGNQVVTQAVVEVLITRFASYIEKYNMSCSFGTNYFVNIPMTTQFDAYSLVFNCDDGSTNRTPWIHPFRYPNVYKKPLPSAPPRLCEKKVARPGDVSR